MYNQCKWTRSSSSWNVSQDTWPIALEIMLHRWWGRAGVGGSVFWDKRGTLAYEKSMVRTPGHKTMEVVIQPLLIRTCAVRITSHESISILLWQDQRASVCKEKRRVERTEGVHGVIDDETKIICSSIVERLDMSEVDKFLKWTAGNEDHINSQQLVWK